MPKAIEINSERDGNGNNRRLYMWADRGKMRASKFTPSGVTVGAYVNVAPEEFRRLVVEHLDVNHLNAEDRDLANVPEADE